ncbi:methyltransferase domain-containing protein [Candidatus Parcubacteria bacterium]|nr:methyltransferase domain-containing protein [Candidatus Parcubacteria bacterium]
MKRTTCRISGEPLVELFSLGDLYISDFLPKEVAPRSEKVPLTMMLAPESGLVQLADTAPFDSMYEQYWYRSGTNESMVAELKDIALSTAKLMSLKPGDVFVDIACNDGTLLSFIDPGVTRIGFDPAKNTYREADQSRFNLFVNDYFTAKAYRESSFGDKKAKVVTTIAMFYDLEDPHSFVKDVKDIMDDNGLWVVQMSYLPLMLKQLAFDNICHEHIEYYSLESFKYLLDKHGMKIVDCQLNDVNGGSFRVYIRKNEADPTTFANAPYRDVAEARVESIFAYEKGLNLKDPQTYIDFYKKCCELRDQTLAFMHTEKAKGKTIWAYGASTKGNTLLQWWGIDNTLIDGIAERQPMKYGLKTVGTNISIASDEDMRAAKPDYLFVLPWHFIESFVRREKEFLERGGKFIVPCPRFEVIGK